MGLAVGIVGMTLAGKTEVSNFLKGKGFGYVRLGQLTERILMEKGLENTEENNQIVREGLRKEHGQDAYAKLNLAEILQKLSKGNVVIDGMYSWSEYKFFKQQLPRFVTVAVYAPPSLRYLRAQSREQRSSRDYFKHKPPMERDYAEIENIEKGGPIAMADYTLRNDRQGKEYLQAELERFWGWLQDELKKA